MGRIEAAEMLRAASQIPCLTARTVRIPSRRFVIQATVDAPVDTSKLEYAAPEAEQRRMVARLRLTRASHEATKDVETPLSQEAIKKLKADMDAKITQLEAKLGVPLTNLKKNI